MYINIHMCVHAQIVHIYICIYIFIPYTYIYMYAFPLEKPILFVACWLGHTVQIKRQVQVLALNQTCCPQGSDFTFLQFHSFPPSVRTRPGHSGRRGGFCAQRACRVNTALLSVLQYCPC